jgi:hypothetical protein
MAAAKKATKKTPAADPMLRIHPVALELSKAGAALWLLDQLHAGELSPLSRRPVGAERMAEPEMMHVNDLALEGLDVRGWLNTLCIDTIADALQGAEGALAKTAGQDARTAAGGAPAAAAAR